MIIFLSGLLCRVRDHARCLRARVSLGAYTRWTRFLYTSRSHVDARLNYSGCGETRRVRIVFLQPVKICADCERRTLKIWRNLFEFRSGKTNRSHKTQSTSPCAAITSRERRVAATCRDFRHRPSPPSDTRR